MSKLLVSFLDIMQGGEEGAEGFCERCLEFMIDLEGQLPTRRYFNTLLHDHLVLPLSEGSKLAKDGGLFSQLVGRLSVYAQFEVDVLTGRGMTGDDIDRVHYQRISGLQRTVFTEFREQLEAFALECVGRVESKDALERVMGDLQPADLRGVCKAVGIRTEKFGCDEIEYFDAEVLVGAIVFKYARRVGAVEVVNGTSLYPDEVCDNLMLNLLDAVDESTRSSSLVFKFSMSVDTKAWPAVPNHTRLPHPQLYAFQKRVCAPDPTRYS
jgi:intron-binding protein aquarius